MTNHQLLMTSQEADKDASFCHPSSELAKTLVRLPPESEKTSRVNKQEMSCCNLISINTKI